MDHWDVIIVGAGPAGATAAYFLTRAGKRVMVLEKDELPRYKPCGGNLSLEYLQRVFPFSFQEVIDRKISSISYEYNGGTEVTIPCRPDVMVMVMRDRFDALILDRSGAVVRTQAKVVSLTRDTDSVTVELESGEKLNADYVIGADGANSTVRKLAGLKSSRTVIGAIEAEVPMTDALRKRYGGSPLFIFDKPRAGYSWIFPKSGYLSVGIGNLGQERDLRGHLIRIMAAHGISLDGVKLHGHPIPVYDHRLKINTGRILLAGDAAGVADPFSGEGIRPAIKSGKLAAEAILQRRTDLYRKWIYAELGRRNRQSLWLWKIFVPLREICLELGAPNPFTTDAILDTISDRHGSLYLAIRSFVTLWTRYLPIEISTALIKTFRGQAAGETYRNQRYPGRMLG